MTSISLNPQTVPVGQPSRAGSAFGRAVGFVFRLFGMKPTASVSVPMSRASRLTLEAEAVRRFAASVSESDPGFAADLYAAADRHELGDHV